MAGTVGNTNAQGNRGGGRKSAREELADIQDLLKIWDGSYGTVEDLKKKIDSGKFGAKDMFAARCLSGESKYMAKLVDKLFANRSHVAVDADVSVEDERTEQLRQMIEDAKTLAQTTGSGSPDRVPVSH